MNGGVIAAILILWGVMAGLRRASGPSQRGPRVGRPEPPGAGGGGPPRTMGDLLAEMRAELQKARARELGLDPATMQPLPKPASNDATARKSRLPAPMPAPPVSEVPVDFDLEAEQIAAQRIAEAEARNDALTDADHQAFDRKVREEKPVVMARQVRRDTLRRAMIWREVLGPPVSLRDEE